MIVTFDTNILVSGFTRPEGRASQAMFNVTLRHDDLFISQPIIEELLRVLENKFNWSAAALASVNGWIARNCQVVALGKPCRSLQMSLTTGSWSVPRRPTRI